MESKFEKIRLLVKKNKPKEVFGHLFELWREKKTDNNGANEIIELVIKLNKSEGIDFCELASKAIEEGFNVFNVMFIFEEVMPHLNLEIKTVIELLEKLYKNTQNDGAAYLQYKPIKELVETQPKFARKLLDKLIDVDRPFVIGYIANLFQSFSKNNVNAIHKELDGLKSHRSSFVINGIVNALGDLDYKLKENSRLLEKTFDIFDTLEERNLEEIDACITHAYGRLLEVSPQASDKLLHFTKKNKPNVDYAVSTILFLNTDKYGDEDWFAELLMELIRTSSNHKGIIDNLDYVLSALVEKKGNWFLAENFFSIWVETSDYKIGDEKLAELFDSTFAAFIKERNNLQKLITKFFNNDSYKFHHAVSELIRFCNLHKLGPLKLDQTELSQLEYEDLLYIGRKILGYILDSKTLCSLTLSLLDKSPRNKKLQGLVHTMFVKHIGQDYPASTTEFLEDEISKSKSKIKSDLAKSVINQIEDYRNARNALQYIKEIIPSSQQTHKILLEQNKVMRLSMEKAQKGSFVSLFKKVPLKYGNGSFSYIRGDYLPVSKLSSYSASMELPSSEICHPVHAAIERAEFRTAKRGDE